MRRLTCLVGAALGLWMLLAVISCAYQSAVATGVNSSPTDESPVLRRRIPIRPVAHFRVEFTGEGCADTVELHWGMREPDTINRLVGDCARVFLIDHEFYTTAPRYVEVIFKRAGDEVGRDQLFVRP